LKVAMHLNEKMQISHFCFSPGSAEALVKASFDCLLSQKHFCLILSKSVCVASYSEIVVVILGR